MKNQQKLKWEKKNDKIKRMKIGKIEKLIIIRFQQNYQNLFQILRQNCNTFLNIFMLKITK